MQDFVEIIFRTDRTGYYYNYKNLEISPETQVVVKVERGEEIGSVVNCSYFDEELEIKFKRIDTSIFLERHFCQI